MPVTSTTIMLMFALVVAAIFYVFVVGKAASVRNWNAVRTFRWQAAGLCAVYVLSLFVVTVLGRDKVKRFGVGLIPFEDIYRIIKYRLPWNVQNVIPLYIVNVGMFVPFGILACEALRPKKISWMILFGFCVSLAIELTQLVTRRGIFDINDLISNVLGAAVGCGIYALYARKRHHKKALGKADGEAEIPRENVLKEADGEASKNADNMRYRPLIEKKL